MNKPDLKRGREYAEKATKGDYSYYRKTYEMGSPTHQILSEKSLIGEAELRVDAEHFAYHSGKRILEIYDYITELEEKLCNTINSYDRINAEVMGKLEAELSEQCRINGMGAQRELALMTKISSLEAQNKKLRWQLHQFKHYGTDDCLNSRACGGRITLLNHTNRCTECAPEDYLSYESRAEEMRGKE